jgi:phage shock protein C
MTAEHSTPFAPEPASVPQARRLYRSARNRVLAGVCGGIAEYYGSDPTAVRLAALVIGLFTGIVPMLILYVIAAVIVPERLSGETGETSQATAGGGSAALVFGAILVMVGVAGFANEWLRIDWDLTWPFVLIGLGLTVFVLALRRH